MKKQRIILFTTGRGPVECGLALNGIQLRFKEFLETEKLKFQIINQKPGPTNRSIETIVFKIDVGENKILDSWLGTLQWICKSPIRKYNKRKNWFIKSCEVTPPESRALDLNDIVIQAYKSSGPGGQHRNKVETAIRIIHKSTGIIVTASDSKSKAQNKKKALGKLRVKLLAAEFNTQKNYDFDKWASSIEIKRGDPSKIFHGNKFIEL